MLANPSKYQEAFFDSLTTTAHSILLRACAGSGKTTTIVHATSLLPPHLLIIFLAFNKNVDDKLALVLPRHVQHGTFHSRCFRALGRSLPKSPKLNKDKVRDILKAATKSKDLPWKDYETYSQFVVKLVSLAKSAGIGALVPNERPEWEKLVDHFALTLDSGGEVDRALALAARALDESNADVSTVDFDDMLYLALLRNVTFDKASFVFIDEAQDTNSVQRALLPKMLAPQGRLIAVGDEMQSIYGFRGADASAMEELRLAFSMLDLPLSICYRCSKAVISEAQKYLN